MSEPHDTATQRQGHEIVATRRHVDSSLSRIASLSGGGLYRLSAAALASASGLGRIRISIGDEEVVCYVSKDGDKPTLLLLHGLTGDKTVWLRCARHLTDRYRLVIPDLAGHGESSFVSSACYQAPAYADRLERLLSALSIDRAHVMGSSLGGWVACELACRAPSRVESIVLLAPAGLESLTPSWLDDCLAAGRNPFLMGSREEFDEFYAALMCQQPRLPALVAHFLCRAYHDGRARIERLFNDFQTGPGLAQRLGGVQAPVSIIWGREDKIVDVSALETWQEALPDAQCETWADVGHLPMLEVPHRIAAHAKNFALTLQTRPL